MIIRNLLVTLLFLVFLDGTIYAQNERTIFGRLNHAWYSMGDMQTLQNELYGQMIDQGYPVKKTESFPAFWDFQGGFLIPISETRDNVLLAGGFIDFCSTGGRIGYADYTGEVHADQLLDAFSIGGIGVYRVHLNERIDLDYQVSARYTTTSMYVSSFVRIQEQTGSRSFGFQTKSLGFEGGIVPSYRLGFIRAGVSLSYLVDGAGVMHPLGYDNGYLQDNNGQKLTADWSGFRVGFVFGFAL